MKVKPLACNCIEVENESNTIVLDIYDNLETGIQIFINPKFPLKYQKRIEVRISSEGKTEIK